MEPINYNFIRVIKENQEKLYRLGTSNTELIEWDRCLTENLFENSKEFNIFKEAVDNNDEDMFDYLLKYEIDIKSNSHTGEIIIYYLILTNSIKYLKKVIDAGINVNQYLYLTIDGKQQFRSPLHVAIIKNLYEIVELLLNNGAEINITDPYTKYLKNSYYDYRSPLSLAVSQHAYGDRIEILKLLMKRGASVNLDVDYRGLKTALQDAIKYARDLKLLKLLLSNLIIDVKLYLKTPYIDQVSKTEQSKEKLSLFLDAGSEINPCLSTVARNAIKCKKFSITCENNCFVIKQHVIKLITAGFDVIGENLRAVQGPEYNGFREDCLEEIQFMKKTKVYDTNLDFYNLLHLSMHRLALRLRNVDEGIISEEDLKITFPHYGGMITFRLGKGMHRKQLLEDVDIILREIFSHIHVPNTFLWEIYWYFSDQELFELATIIYNSYVN